MKLKTGTKIICAYCGEPQLESTQEIDHGGKMADGKWISLGFDMESESTACYKCGQMWYRTNFTLGGNELHTEEGWVNLLKRDPNAVH